MAATLVLAAVLAAPVLATATAVAAVPDPGDPVDQRFRAITTELQREHASPRALARLVEIGGLEDALPDLAHVAAVYARVAEDGAAHPEVRALARLRLAAVERARGDAAAEGEQLAKLGFISGWSIAGPFDNAGKSGFETAYGPERDADPGARFPGKAREVGWRPLPPEASQGGFVNVGAVVRPAREVVVYALATVASARARQVQLRIGSSGALQVLVNGALVHGDPRYHVARLDQVSIPIRLQQGANRIVLKLCHAEGRLGFYARLTDERPWPRDVVAELEQLVRATGRERAAALQYDLAVAVAERRSGDDRDQRALREARRAAELAPTSIPPALLAARLEEDPNRRRAGLGRAFAAHPDSPELLVAMAALEADRGRLVPARRLLERAVALAPRYVAARLALATVWERAGFTARAHAEQAAIAREYPSRRAALVAAARAARADDRLDAATRLYRAALVLRHDDAATRASLGQLLVERGEVDAAVTLLEEGLRLAPADVDARARIGELLAANGRPERSEAAFADALRIAPDDAELRERRGQARLRAGREREALQDFAAALELRPQNPQLKELVRAMEPARERFEEPYLLDGEALAAAAAPPSDADAVILGELRVTRVFPSGLASRVTQLVIRILTDRGAEAWRTWTTAYGPGRQEVRVDRVRIRKPDGTLLRSFQESDRSLSEPWYRLYYDDRQRQLSFPALSRGDVLEIVVRTDDVASENLLADYFGELVFLADATPKLRMDYVLLVPEGRRIYSNRPTAPGTTWTERPLAGGVVEHRWSARDVPRVHSEPGMPGWTEVVPYVHVSTYATWDDVARFYWALVRDQLTPTSEIREVALRLAGEARADRRARGEPAGGDELAIIQAVHRFVVSQTRYVGLEFGIHGYKPYRVDQVLERRFGDCKDKASLAHALLASLGIDARLVLLRMRRLGAVPEVPASLAVFNHAILYVPGYDLWLDGTASYAGSRDLPAEDRGATVLVVNPEGPPRFTVIPEQRPDENVTATRYDVQLTATGGAVVTGETRVGGVHAPAWRRAYATEADRRPQLEHTTARALPGARVESLAVSDVARLEDDVTVHFSLALGALAERDGEALRILPFGRGQRYAEALAPLSERRYDLLLGPPAETRITWRYQLPAGFAAALPPPVRIDAPYASIEVTYRDEPGAFVAEARLVTRTRRIAAAEYPAFRAFLGQVDAAFSRPVRVAAVRR